jgi:hypothetical protein
MPYVSQAQRVFMRIHHPEIAKEFEAKTPKGTKLPEHVGEPEHPGEKEPEYAGESEPEPVKRLRRMRPGK